jgi:hypothetical protein
MTHGEGKDHTVIRCWPADGDHVKFFPPKRGTSGVAKVSVAYSLGADFHSWPIAERKARVVELFRLLQTGINEAIDEIEVEFHGDKRLIEPPTKLLSGDRLKARFKEIDRKQSKQSFVVSGGLPSLGKRQ